MTRSRILAVMGIGLLAVVGILGWVRKPEAAPQSFVDPAAPSALTSDYAGGNAGSLPAYASRPPVRTIEQQPVQAQVEPQTYARPYADRSTTTRRVVRRKRPLRNSVAIVGGSAGVGAAIGALAGGGKGAGIGALAGGAGGFVYDRLTHDRKVEQ